MTPREFINLYGRATVEIRTFDFAPQIILPYDADRMCFSIIPDNAALQIAPEVTDGVIGTQFQLNNQIMNHFAWHDYGPIINLQWWVTQLSIASTFTLIVARMPSVILQPGVSEYASQRENPYPAILASHRRRRSGERSGQG